MADPDDEKAGPQIVPDKLGDERSSQRTPADEADKVSPDSEGPSRPDSLSNDDATEKD